MEIAQKSILCSDKIQKWQKLMTTKVEDKQNSFGIIVILFCIL